MQEGDLGRSPWGPHEKVKAGAAGLAWQGSTLGLPWSGSGPRGGQGQGMVSLCVRTHWRVGVWAPGMKVHSPSLGTDRPCPQGPRMSKLQKYPK